jgi:hypothetical protein
MVLMPLAPVNMWYTVHFQSEARPYAHVGSHKAVSQVMVATFDLHMPLSINFPILVEASDGFSVN